MTRRLPLFVMLAAGFAFLVLFAINESSRPDESDGDQAQGERPGTMSPGERDSEAPREAQGGASGTSSQRHALEETWKVKNRIDDDDGYLGVLSSIGATFSSVQMLKEQYRQAANEERLNPLPEVLRGRIPERFYENSLLELVWAWDPESYPFRIRFDALQHNGEVRRVLRGPAEDGQIDPTDRSVFRIAESEVQFTTTYPEVQRGDQIELTVTGRSGEPSLHTIEEVRKRRLVVSPRLPELADDEVVSYRVLAEGPFQTIYHRDARYTLVSRDEQRLVFVWPNPESDTSDLFIERELRLTGPYDHELDIVLHNFGDQEVTGRITMLVRGFQPPVRSGGIFSGPPPDQRSAMCHAGGKAHRASLADLLAKPRDPDWSPSGDVSWVGIESRYFLLAAVPLNLSNSQCFMEAFRSEPPEGVATAGVGRTKSWVIPPAKTTCLPSWMPRRPGFEHCETMLARLGLEGDTTNRVIDDTYDEVRRTLDGAKLEEAREARDALMGRRATLHRYLLYAGPKDLAELQAQDAGLEDSIDFWVVGIIAKPMVHMLKMFHGWIPNWGVAIVLLTLLVKVALLYFTHKSFKSMHAMQKLKPHMDELRAKYSNDRQKLNEEMMALYKRHKVNPLGGCLPMLLQMPVWIALYRSIYASVELYQAPLFGWIQDMSAPDPYYVLPLVMGLSMFLQQRLMPPAMDAQQARIMMYMMPIMFTVFMLFLPAGLVLYIFVNTLLGMAQQYYIKRKGATEPAAAGAARG